MSFVPGAILGQNPVTGEFGFVWKDVYTGGLVTVPIEHAAIHLGIYFSHSGVITLAPGAEFLHLFKTPAAGGKHIHLRTFIFDATSAPLLHRLYEAPTVTAEGTARAGVNFNRNAGASVMGLFHFPTISANGELLGTNLVTGTEVTGGHGASSGTEWPLKPGTYYLSSIRNDSVITTDVAYACEWYEL